MRALEQANRIRLARAELKRRIAKGDVAVADVLLDPSDEISGMEISELLTDSGFEVLDSRDDETQHFVTARRN